MDGHSGWTRLYNNDAWWAVAGTLVKRALRLLPRDAYFLLCDGRVCSEKADYSAELQAARDLVERVLLQSANADFETGCVCCMRRV